VRQNIAIQRIQAWIVDVGRQYAFAQVVQNHDPRRSAQPPKGFSCSSAHTRELERNASSRIDFRLQPSVMTNSLVRRYLPLSGSRTIGPVP
jgi:hypothetical protein